MDKLLLTSAEAARALGHAAPRRLMTSSASASRGTRRQRPIRTDARAPDAISSYTFAERPSGFGRGQQQLVHQ